jgi:hypothetical protein
MAATPTRLTIGTRGSVLARWQAEWVKTRLQAAHPGLDVSLAIIKTTGDKVLDVPLANVGGKGLFVKEIEEAAARGDRGSGRPQHEGRAHRIARRTPLGRDPAVKIPTMR